ncbi:cell envelope integrity protein CreD [Shewanella pneumatophori]|uniref:Cell envelope integrity protein CreD n=1 Tax=Shewanella pneumatophori TaxID=314092 RepID=A0A9X1Z9G3_9GAMM|nr:cell envelope integrity protein CreD [Shewanella pneumatophori]MCL1137363.1 cell envelope integrity protein CreD [Shewanella pneumatophori]
MKKILNNQVVNKFGFVLLLFVLLQIPLTMVTDLISERSYRLEEVRSEIARSSTGEQRIIGPFITVNFTEVVNHEGKSYFSEHRKYILPEVFNFDADLESYAKYRGIYQARLYKADSHLTGSFDLNRITAIAPEKINSISMVVGVADSRGLIKLNKMQLDGKTIEVQPGTGLNQFAQGFHTNLDLAQLLAISDNKEAKTSLQLLKFDFSFLLQGMESIQISPIGKESNISMASAWPHPSFTGDFLPISSDISDNGFNAQWVSNNFSSNISQLFEHCMVDKAACAELERRQMGVDLIEPVDHYLKSHRAVNYSLLVITLVFASFFLLELFQARPMHPVQYGFVGLALALFYLLLISLSEHTGFNWAYIMSAIASTLLLSIYVGGMLANAKHGRLFGLCLMGLYGLLFGLLQAESYALLMGSLLCFAILSLLMVMTRNVDWYAKSNEHVDVVADVAKDTPVGLENESQ